MLIFYFDGFEEFAKGITDDDAEIGKFSIETFPDGETLTSLNIDVTDKECVIIGTIEPPASNLFEVAKLSEAIMRNGAKSVSLYAPYLAYTRQSEAGVGEGNTFHLICAMLRVAGIDRIMTIDPHGKVALGLSFGFPVHSVDSTSIIAKELENIRSTDKDIMIISADRGYTNNTKSIAEELNVPYLILDTTHGKTEIIVSPIEKSLPKHVVVVDDMIDTGRTLIMAVKALKLAGAERFTIYATHGLFVGDEWQELFNLGVSRIITTDSTKKAREVAEKDKRVQLITLVGMFRKIFERY